MEFTLKPPDHAVYGTLIYENKYMDFDEAKANEIEIIYSASPKVLA